jgi:hypothetical protein
MFALIAYEGVGCVQKASIHHGPFNLVESQVKGLLPEKALQPVGWPKELILLFMLYFAL